MKLAMPSESLWENNITIEDALRVWEQKLGEFRKEREALGDRLRKASNGIEPERIDRASTNATQGEIIGRLCKINYWIAELNILMGRYQRDDPKIILTCPECGTKVPLIRVYYYSDRCPKCAVK